MEIVRFTAEQAGVENLGVLNIVSWQRNFNSRHATTSEHSLPVAAIYTKLTWVAFRYYQLGVQEYLRTPEDFSKTLVRGSAPDISIEAYYQSLAASEGFMRLGPLCRKRMVGLIARNDEMRRSCLLLDKLTTADSQVGLNLEYVPPADEDTLIAIRNSMANVATASSSRNQ